MATHVLLLEDNPADVRLMQEAFAELNVDAVMDVTKSAKEALSYFESCMTDSNKPFPSLAILDINLPAGSGLDVLRFIRTQHAMRDMPVLMLTTSDHADDIRAAKEGGATTYYVKPADLDGFLSLVEELRAFWLERTPSRP